MSGLFTRNVDLVHLKVFSRAQIFRGARKESVNEGTGLQACWQQYSRRPVQNCYCVESLRIATAAGHSPNHLM